MRKIPSWVLAFALPLVATAQEAPQQQQRADHYIDHIVLGIQDLERGTEEVHRLTGVKPKFDGRNAADGTHSAIIALGDKTFLEIRAPDPKADTSAIDPELAAKSRDRLENYAALTPFGWAIGTGNVELSRNLSTRAGSRVTDTFEGARSRSMSREINWTWFGVRSPESTVSPIFVHWHDAKKRPQDRAPGSCELTGIHINTRFYKVTHNLIAATRIDAEATSSEDESLTFSLDCPRGEVVFEGITLTSR